MLIIGERINTSTKKIASAVERRDVDFIQKEAITQVRAGAKMIDVNAGTFISEEPESLRWLVQTIQHAVDLPLCLDSSNPMAIATALAARKGNAMINSITAQKDRFLEMLPVIKEYKCSVVALCLSDTGIPTTVEERVEVASHLVRKLEDEGIPRDTIYVDPVVTPLSVNAHSAKDALDTIEIVMKLFEGIHTICGVSNVSFGLPFRQQLNQIFLMMAMTKGLDAAILDPRDIRMMMNIITADAISGRDEFCLNYINAYREGKLIL